MVPACSDVILSAQESLLIFFRNGNSPYAYVTLKRLAFDTILNTPCTLLSYLYNLEINGKIMEVDQKLAH